MQVILPSTPEIPDAIHITAPSDNLSILSDGFSVAIGSSTCEAIGAQSVAIGYQAISTGANSLAIGRECTTANQFDVALGYNCDAASGSVALGNGSIADTASSVAIGDTATTSGASYATAMGYHATVTGNYGVAIGRGSSAGSNGVAIGGIGATAGAGEVVFGGDGFGVTDAYFGQGKTATAPSASMSINATGGTGTNIAGSALILAGGKATGNAAGGSVKLQTSTAGSSGASVQSLATNLEATPGALSLQPAGGTITEFGTSLPAIAKTATRTLTTDATVTTAATYAIASGKSYTITVVVTARRTGGAAGAAGDSASYIIQAGIKDISGTATLMATAGSNPLVTIIGEDQVGWDATIDVNSSNARVRVTGAVNNNITWDVAVQAVSVN